MKASRFYFAIIAATIFVLVSSAMAFAQVDSTSKAQSADTLGMYALLEPTPQHEPGPVAQMMQKFAPLREPKVPARPMMLWYHWANQPKPFGASFILVLLTAITISSLFPRWTANAEVECKTRFWRTFFVGVLAFAIGMAAVRGALVTMIGWPLAILLVGFVQLSLLAGLTVMVLLVGQSIGYYLKFESWIKRPDVRRLACILAGVIVCTLLLQIPGFGALPRIGTRLVALLAVVGFGGLFRSRAA